jgi:hypothetical protein
LGLAGKEINPLDLAMLIKVPSKDTEVVEVVVAALE